MITQLHLDIINMSVRSHKKLSKDVQQSIVNKATLIRKYERRLSLISM